MFLKSKNAKVNGKKAKTKHTDDTNAVIKLTKNKGDELFLDDMLSTFNDIAFDMFGNIKNLLSFNAFSDEPAVLPKRLSQCSRKELQ